VVDGLKTERGRNLQKEAKFQIIKLNNYCNRIMKLCDKEILI
jgi:hypothetical protein